MKSSPFSSLINAPTLLLAGLAVYLPFFWQLPLMRAEAMYALIPQEMLSSGSWLTPTLNGAPYLDKPHLLYWLNLLAFKVLGVSDWAARVPTLMVTLGEVWLTYLIGQRLLGREAAWLGGFILLSCIGFFALHLQILLDHLITLNLAASLYFLLRWEKQPRVRWAVLYHLTLVAGFLSKGFIGLGFPLLIGGLYAWWVRRPGLVGLFISPRGLTLVLVLILPWFLGVEHAHPGFLKHQLINEQVLRFLGQRQPQDLNGFSLAAFWLFLLIWLMPWTVLLPEGLWRFWRETRPGQGVTPEARLLLIWAAVILGFFTLSSSRIEYYSLPALPPLALILGWRLKQYVAGPGDVKISGGLAVVALLGVSTLLLLPYLEQLCGDNRREFLGMFAVIAPLARPVTFLVPLLALAGVVAGWRRPRVTVGCFGLLALTLVFFTFRILLALSPQLTDKIPGEYLRARLGPQDLVVMEHIEEFEYGASLAFYAGRRVLMVQRQGLPQFPYPVSPKENFLISPARLQELWQGPQRVFVLMDNEAHPPEPFLETATLALSLPGKRLLLNRP
jgi:4-amino-4-deoxy-L-arabinose transferase-like glycosyltransferase